jgi:capsular exopolysaccharide synthesis family protein
MARIAARDGLRCLAIDCDFRRPALAGAVDAKPQQWLSDFLLNSEERSQTGLITSDRLSDASYILTRPVRPMSRRLLESPRLQHVIENARESFDLVLVDTPPIMNVADPIILSRFADAIVMVVSSRGADRSTVLEAVHRAEITCCPVAGLVMSQVGNDVGDRYSYAGYGPPQTEANAHSHPSKFRRCRSWRRRTDWSIGASAEGDALDLCGLRAELVTTVFRGTLATREKLSKLLLKSKVSKSLVCLLVWL